MFIRVQSSESSAQSNQPTRANRVAAHDRPNPVWTPLKLLQPTQVSQHHQQQHEACAKLRQAELTCQRLPWVAALVEQLAIDLTSKHTLNAKQQIQPISSLLFASDRDNKACKAAARHDQSSLLWALNDLSPLGCLW